MKFKYDCWQVWMSLSGNLFIMKFHSNVSDEMKDTNELVLRTMNNCDAELLGDL